MLMFFAGISFSQTVLNDKADNILGVYLGEQKGDVFKARITKAADGTYKGQIFWMKNDRQPNGSKRLDTKNPDKRLRHVPCDQVVLFSGLKHNPQKQCWDGTKIYDPQRGFTADVCPIHRHRHASYRRNGDGSKRAFCLEKDRMKN